MELRNIKIPKGKSTRFVLMGAGIHLCTMARLLIEYGFPKPVILTYPKERHQRDRLLLKTTGLYEYVFDFAKECDIEIIESPTVNREALVKNLLGMGCTAAFSLSCRSIIKKPFLDAFDDRVFNIHPSMLPAERGGGLFSWRILRGETHVAATIHLVDEGIDSGPVIDQHLRNLVCDRPTPRDFLIETNKVYAELLEKFVDVIRKDAALQLQPQDGAASSYLPRLFTEVNGAIDWTWSVTELDRFIRAFSDPYPGAFTFVRGRRISILDAVPELSVGGGHPFIAGRVTQVFPDGSVRLVIKDGALLIRRIAIGGNEVRPTDVIGLLDTLNSPLDMIFNARATTINVKDMGLIEK
jgi:methionyl-tRNA formyltransferase